MVRTSGPESSAGAEGRARARECPWAPAGAHRGGVGPAYAEDVSIVLRYTLLRLSLLALVGLVLYAVGLSGLWWFVLTAVVSILLSLVLLRGPREQMTQALIDRQHQRQQGGGSGPLSRRIDADADAEDAADEARREGGRREGGPGPGSGR